MREKLSNPKETIRVIQKYQFGFQKKFGQNFLIDAHVLEKIIVAAVAENADIADVCCGIVLHGCPPVGSSVVV